MMVTVSPAFAQAELEYRQQRIKADFAARTSQPVRRVRPIVLFKQWRRPNLTPRRPMPAPHRLTSGT